MITTDNSSKQTNTNSESKKYMIKVVVLGDINVGKSNIIRRLLGEDFEELEATVGVEFGYLEAKDVDRDDPSVSLSVQLWDTSGAERYRAITTSHIRNADGALLVYDINSELSFQALEFWVDTIRKCSSEDIVIYLVGNKSDLALYDNNMRRVTKQNAIEFVNKHNLCHWTECSAKLNVNIKDTFKSFYKRIYAVQKYKLDDKTKNMKKLIAESSKNQDSKSKCC